MKLENVLLFAASLVIAILLWYQAVSDTDPTREREVQVKLVQDGLPEGLVVIQAPESVAVVASGPREALDDLRAEDLKATVDLSRGRAGTGAFVISADEAPMGISLRVIRPRLELEIDRLVEESRRVEIETSGVPDSKYLYQGAAVDPEEVTVRAPAGAMRRVFRVRAALDLRGAEPSDSFSLLVQAVDSDGRPVPQAECIPSSVSAAPAIQAASTTKSLFIDPIWTGSPAPGFRVLSYQVAPQSVRVTGSSEALSAISTIRTGPISIDGLRESREFTARLALPEGLAAPGAETVKVTIKIGRATGGS